MKFLFLTLLLFISTSIFSADLDKDGVDAVFDCNDYDSSISSEHIYYLDENADGFGDLGSQISVCSLTPPQGYTYWGEDIAFSTKEERTMALEFYSTSQSETFQNNIDFAAQFGIKNTSLGIQWDRFEISEGVYVDNDVQSLEVLDTKFFENNLGVSLTLWTINGRDLTIPQYIKDQGLRMNAPEVVDAFKSFLDWTFSKLSNTTVTSLQIGNEIDHFFNQHLSTEACGVANKNLDYPGDYQFYIEYFEFLAQIKQYIIEEKNFYGKSPFPIGVTATMHGLTHSPTKEIMLAGNEIADMVNVTYYPLTGKAQMLEHYQVFYDLTELINLYPNKPIYIQEIGYASDVINRSSETKQKQFINAFFWTWDIYKERIPFAQFLMMTDWSEETLDFIVSLPAYSCLENPEFLGYLGSLGLRNKNGSFKQGFYTLYSELQRRGFTP